MSEQIDPQQLDNLTDAVNNLTATLGGTASKTSSLSSSFGKMNPAAAGALKALEKLGGGAADLTKSLYKGEKGSAQFGSAVEDAADAIGMMLLVLAPFSLAAKVATIAIGALAKGITIAAKQGDALYKTYQDLQRSGAAAADGITGVFKNMQNFGYGIEELDKMVQLVSANSETLAKFSVTAADGTKSFAGAMQDVVRDPQLRLLGKTADDMNAAGAAYIKQQVAGGRTQKDIGDNLGASTKQYIMDLDRLQRLTGTSADALQKQQDEAMSEDAYNDVMADLQARAASGDAAATAEIKKITTTMANLSPEMQKQFQRSIGGDISAQQQLFMRMPSLMKNVQDESVSVGQTMGDAKKDIDNYVNTFGKSYRLNADGMREFGGSLRSAREEAIQFGKYDEAQEAINNQTNVTDDATKNLTKINLDQMNARDSLQSFVQLGVAPATKKLAELSNVVGGLSGTLPGTGKGGSRPGFSGNLEQLGGGASGAGGKGAGSSQNAEQALKFFQAAGWSKEQAAGIVGNLQTESGKNLDTTATGDGGKAKGIAQWHPDRQAKFKEVIGKDISQSTLEDQLKFVDWELKNTEKSAGDKLKQAKSAAQAAQIVDKTYERSSGAATGTRMANADALLNSGNLLNKTVIPSSNLANNQLPSGPSGSYDNKLADLNAGKSLPVAQPSATPAQSTSDTTNTHTNLLTMMVEKLDLLNRTNSNQLAVQKKTLQVAS